MQCIATRNTWRGPLPIDEPAPATHSSAERTGYDDYVNTPDGRPQQDDSTGSVRHVGSPATRGRLHTWVALATDWAHGEAIPTMAFATEYTTWLTARIYNQGSIHNPNAGLAPARYMGPITPDGPRPRGRQAMGLQVAG